MPTVLVTGAARGLGLELVRQYAADGWTVFACVRSPPVQADASRSTPSTSPITRPSMHSRRGSRVVPSTCC